MSCKTWLLGLVVATTLLVGGAACTVEQAPAQDPSSQGASAAGANQSGGADCRAQQDACVQNCKRAAPDEASRQPCYNDCLRRSQACGG